jgi:hypothetical protein
LPKASDKGISGASGDRRPGRCRGLTPAPKHSSVITGCLDSAGYAG